MELSHFKYYNELTYFQDYGEFTYFKYPDIISYGCYPLDLKTGSGSKNTNREINEELFCPYYIICHCL